MGRIITLSIAVLVTPVVIVLLSPKAKAQHRPGYVACDIKWQEAGKPAAYEKFMENCLAPNPSGQPNTTAAGSQPNMTTPHYGSAQDYSNYADSVAKRNQAWRASRGQGTQGQAAFDGGWSAFVGPFGTCNFVSILTLDVVSSSIVGNVSNPRGVFPLSGTVNPSGLGVFKIGTFAGTVRFSGTRFEAHFANGCGGRVAFGTKNGG
jgi:hypothetical protein